MRDFIKGRLDGFARFWWLAGRAIGGIAIVIGLFLQDYFLMCVGETIILANMVASIIAYVRNKEK